MNFKEKENCPLLIRSVYDLTRLDVVCYKEKTNEQICKYGQ